MCSPHNPTGKVFSRQEMEALAAIVRSQPRMLVVSDEVYKYTIYDGHSEVRTTSRCLIHLDFTFRSPLHLDPS